MNNQQRQILIVGGVIAAAALILIVVIFAGNQPTGSAIDYAAIPQSRTADGAFVIGNPEAPVTIVEFADWACPHCQDYRPTIDRFISEQVATGRAKFEYRIFPTAGGQLTVFAGQLAECAEEQRAGAFWQAHTQLFDYATSGRYTEEMGRILASALNLDYAALLECSSSASQVQTDTEFGRTRGVQGTPAVMVRYGDSDAQFISFGGTTYNRSTVPIDVLTNIVQLAQAAG